MSALLLLLLPQLAATSPCSDAIERHLAVWNATREVLRAPAGPLGGSVYRIATGEVGEWITLHQPRNTHIVSLFRTTPAQTVRLDFGDTCAPEPVTSQPGVHRAPDAVTDADIKELLAADERLVVYLWSPHLPLSVEGYHEASVAAASHGVPFIATVDATAERGYVERVGDEAGIPREARRPMGSVELLFRDIAVHTPSMLVFFDGRVSAPLPGFRNREAYRAHLDTILGGGD